MVFSAVSMVSLIEADDDTIWLSWARKIKQTTVCFVAPYWQSLIYNKRGAGKIIQHSCFTQTKMKWSSSSVVSTHILGPVHLGGGGGALLACDMYSFWCDWAFMVLLADQHWKQSYLAGGSTCFWTHCTEYLQQVTQSTVSAGTWYWWLYFSLVLGKHLLVKTGLCQSSRGSKM